MLLALSGTCLAVPRPDLPAGHHGGHHGDHHGEHHVSVSIPQDPSPGHHYPSSGSSPRPPRPSHGASGQRQEVHSAEVPDQPEQRVLPGARVSQRLHQQDQPGVHALPRYGVHGLRRAELQHRDGGEV